MNTLSHIKMLAVAGLFFANANANAAIIATTSQIDQNDPAPVVSTTDLGQTAALSFSATGQTDFLGVFYVASPGEVNQLFNGEVGNTDGDANDSGETVVNTATNSNGSTFTINFDVSTNTFGYDITEIFSVAGWNTSGGGRSNQGYDIDLTFVDNSTAKLSSDQTWIAGPVSDYWTTVSLTNNGGGVLSEGSVSATGVKSITFSLFDPPPPGGFVSYREFDIIGTATIPEPSTFALLGLAGLAALLVRRRR
jgi:hypothetical protein